MKRYKHNDKCVHIPSEEEAGYIEELVKRAIWSSKQ